MNLSPTRRKGGQLVAAGSPALRHNADFLRLWAGQTISQLGSQVTVLALPLAAVLDLRATPLQVGLLGAAQSAPFLVFGLLVGVWVDRRPRRPLLIAADLGRAALLGVVPLASLSGWLSVGLLCAIAFGVGSFTLLADVALQSFLPTLVGREHLLRGNSRLEATNAGAQVIGPGLAGALVQALSAPRAVAVDALSFLLSALALALVRVEEAAPPSGPGGTTTRAALWAGVRAIATRPLLRALALYGALSNFSYTIVMSVFVLFMTRSLGLDPGQIGVVFACGSVGALLGALLVEAVVRRIGLGALFVVATLLIGLGCALIPLADGASPRTIALLVAAEWISVVGLVINRINNTSLRQRLTPDHLQGRVNATVRFLTWGTIPLGNLLGGVLGGVVGLRETLIIGAVGQAIALLSVFLSPLRSLHGLPESDEPVVPPHQGQHHQTPGRPTSDERGDTPQAATGAQERR